MAEPASKLPEEDRPDIQPDIRPNLGVIQGGGEGDGVPRGQLRSAEENIPSGLYNPDGEKAAPTSSGGLKSAEESGAETDDDDRVGSGYNAGNSSSTSRFRGRLRITRRKAIVGLGASSIVSIIFGITSISSGPLEFIHIAQLLDKFHFSSQQNAEDSRLMKIARYLNDPSKPENTRLGLVGKAVAGKLDTKIKDTTGLEPDFNKGSARFKGYKGDRNHDQFKGKSAEEIKTELAAAYGLSPNNIHVSDTQVTFNPEEGIRNPVTAYRAQTRVARAQLGAAGYSKISQRVGSRVLRQRAGWTFHPIKKLDAKIQAKALEGGKKALDKLKEQFQTDETGYVEGTIEKPGGTASAQQKTDAKGNPLPPDPNAQQNADGVNGIKDSTQNVDPNNPQSVSDAKASLTKKITGGTAGALGAICVFDSINQAVPAERQAKVIAPMMKMAGEAISLGSQAQSGQDISALQLGFFKDKLDAKDPKTGQVTSTWNEASSIQAELGQPQSNHDIPKEGQVFDSGLPFPFLDIGVVHTACSIINSTFGTLFSIVTGPVNFAFQTIANQIVLGPALGYLTNWLSGTPISPLAAGAKWGNYVNYGGRLAANQQFASAGGVQLSSSSAGQVASIDNSLDRSSFESHSLAYKLFDASDSRTLAGHIADSENSGGAIQNITSMISKFGSVFGAAMRAPASLFTGVTHAAQPYDYHGLKKVGFRAEDLGNTAYDNPFENACRVTGGPGCKVTGIFENPDKANQYTTLASQCFGVNIKNDPSSGWIIDNNGSSIDFQSGNYPSDTCSSDSDTNWVRVRFWILDTATIEGYDCYQSNTTTSDQSCQDVGFQSDGSSTNTPVSSPTGTLPTGSSQTLAKQLVPYLGNKITCNGGEGTKCSDISNTANGVSIKGGSCQVDALQPGVLGMLLELVQMGHSFVISALCSDHSTVDGLRGHNGGRAVDFNYIDGQFMGPSDVPWDNAKTIKAEKFDQDIASFMPKSTGFGQIQCHPTFSFLQGFDTFDDACHHQHVQVET